MKAEKYHTVLWPVEEACRLARTGWVCVANPLVGWGREGQLRWKAGVLLRHAVLVFRCWRLSAHRHILVREFSTVPLLLVFPLLYPLRRKIYFLMHHNLQWSFLQRTERVGLRLLHRMGARWAVMESQDLEGLGPYGIPSERNIALPLPVSRRIAARGPQPVPVIGLAGCYRPEKGMDGLLRLLAHQFADCEILLGTPSAGPVPDVSRNVRIMDTTTDEAYHRMLAQCDVLVHNGAKESYFYRVSGPVADAAACGTAVVVPDFPLLRHQVSWPVPVGELFRSPDDLPDAVRRAVEKRRAGQYDFSAYCAARSAQALAEYLDEFSRRQDG